MLDQSQVFQASTKNTIHYLFNKELNFSFTHPSIPLEGTHRYEN